MDLAEDEKESMTCLLKHNAEIQYPMLIQRSSSTVIFAERLKNRRKRYEIQDDYINCDFILGSDAEVERLWSISKYVLTESRRSMTAQLFEAIVFLKVNESFWGTQSVSEASHLARSTRANARIEAHEAQEKPSIE